MHGTCRPIGGLRCCWLRVLISSARFWRSGSAMRQRSFASLARAGRDHSDREQDQGRRDCSGGARYRPQPHQEGRLLGDRRRRSAVGRGRRPDGFRLHLGCDRRAVHALNLLEGYCGIVQCEGYTAYKTIANTIPDAAITLVLLLGSRGGALIPLSRTVLQRSRVKRSSVSPLSRPSRSR